MPAFIYTIIILTGLSWWGVIRILTSTKPDSLLNIAFLLIVSWAALTLTFSLVIYVWFHKKAQKFIKLKPLYRKSVKKSLSVSMGIVLLMALKAFGLLTPINILLLLVLAYAIFWKAKRHK